MPDLNITSETWDAIDAHAVEGYAEGEVCGIVTADADGALTVHRCENIQNKLHASDPEAHPRDAKTAYRMNDLAVLKIVTAAEDAGGRMAAIYHSHVDCDAYFSEEDQRAAQFDGEPAHPDVIYLVVSVVDGVVKARKAFDWDAGAGQYEEVSIAEPV